MDATGIPVEVDSTDEEIVARVAAIDVAKDSGVVCVRAPRPAAPGKRATRVWTVPSRTNAIMALAGELVEQGVERIVLEATSDYWRRFYYLLEAAGLTVWLVNARDVKNVPGRPKTDKLDAVWLAKLNERGMLRASFVPPVDIRQLRDYTRLRVDLTGDRTRQVQRLEKLLEDALIKLSSVATDIMGVSARAMLQALIDGERDPQVLAELAKGRATGQAGRAGADQGADWTVRRTPRRTGRPAAEPDRRAEHRDRAPGHTHRTADCRHPRRRGTRRGELR
jgi:transposase